MARYVITAQQLFIYALLTALISAGSVVGYFQYKEHSELPIVQTFNATCVQVLNYKNGDAYNCHDVNVLLRRYREVKVDRPASAGQPASSPDAINK